MAKRQIGLHRTAQSEPPRHDKDVLDADQRCELDRRHIAGLDQGLAQCNLAFELAIVIGRLPDPAESVGEADGSVENRAVRLHAVFEGCRVHKGLERRADLAHGLRGTVELAGFKIVTADHGLDLAGGVVQGDESPLDLRDLIQHDRGGFAVVVNGDDLEGGEIAGLENLRRQLGFGPGDFLRAQRGAVFADPDGDVADRRRFRQAR